MDDMRQTIRELAADRDRLARDLASQTEALAHKLRYTRLLAAVLMLVSLALIIL